MAVEEITEVFTREVSCDGGGGALGHPKIFLTISEGVTECPYCGRRFVLNSRSNKYQKN